MRKLFMIILPLFAITLFIASTAFTQMPDYGTISGMVVDQDSGDPISWAMVAVIDPEGYHRPVAQGYTDEAGNYILDVPYGEYLVKAHAYNYLPEYWEEVDNADEATLITVSEESNPENIDFTLSPYTGPSYGSIAGAIYNSENDEPIAGAFVEIRQFDYHHFHRIAYTDEDGSYLFDDVPEGDYRVTAAADGFVTAEYPETIVVSGDDITGIDFQLEPLVFGSISGTVYDGSTSEVLAEAIIVARIPGHDGYRTEAVSGEDGTYSLTDLPAGEYTLYCSKQGYETEEYSETIEVDGNDIVDIDFTLTLIQVGGIAGVVTDSATGEPIENALVFAIGDYHPHCHNWAITDENGEYMIELTSGEYYVHVMAWGYSSFTTDEPIVIIDQVETFDIALNGYEFGSLTGTVYNVQEEPIANAVVDIRIINGHYHRCVRTDETGSYLIENIIPGSYRVRAFAMGYMPQTYEDTVEIGDGEEVTGIDFYLETWESPYNGVISGVVTDDSTGEPIAEAAILAIAPGYRWRGHIDRTHSDEQGAYSFNNLREDVEYKVFCMATDYHSEFYDDKLSWHEADPVTPDAENIDFALTPVEVNLRNIGGQVVEADTPVDGAVVMAILDDEVVGVATTYPDGYYYLDDIEPGEYTLTVISPEGAEGSIEISAVYEDIYDADIVLSPTSVDGETIAVPSATGLLSNYPNPFNATTTISFDLTDDTEVKLAIYDLLGRKVNTLFSGTLSAGQHSYIWHGVDRGGNQVSSGIYLYVLKTAGETFSNRMLLLK